MKTAILAGILVIVSSVAFAFGDITSKKYLDENMNLFATSISKIDHSRKAERMIKKLKKHASSEFLLEYERLNGLITSQKITSYQSYIAQCGFFNEKVKSKMLLFFDKLMLDLAFNTVQTKEQVAEKMNAALLEFPKLSNDELLSQLEKNQMLMSHIALAKNMNLIIDYVFSHNDVLGKGVSFGDVICSLAGQIVIIAICTVGGFIGMAMLCGTNCAYLGSILGFVGGTFLIRACKYTNTRGHRSHH